MPILSTPETTGVIYGEENVMSKQVKGMSEIKTCAVACWDSTGPSAAVASEMWTVTKELLKRSVSLRAITGINEDNISYCRR